MHRFSYNMSFNANFTLFYAAFTFFTTQPHNIIHGDSIKPTQLYQVMHRHSRNCRFIPGIYPLVYAQHSRNFLLSVIMVFPQFSDDFGIVFFLHWYGILSPKCFIPILRYNELPKNYVWRKIHFAENGKVFWGD